MTWNQGQNTLAVRLATDQYAFDHCRPHLGSLLMESGSLRAALAIVRECEIQRAGGEAVSCLSFDHLDKLEAHDLPPLVAAISSSCPWVRHVDLRNLQCPAGMCRYTLPLLLRLVKSNHLLSLNVSAQIFHLNETEKESLQLLLLANNKRKARRQRHRELGPVTGDIVFFLRRENRSRVDAMTLEMGERATMMAKFRQVRAPLSQ